MNQRISSATQYSASWQRESQLLEANGVYEMLALTIPRTRVLEMGCGAGNGTSHLAQGREVLALDNNELLIEKASARLKSDGLSAHIHHCDFFGLRDEDLTVISEFQPKVVVGWFLGSHGEDIRRHTPIDFDDNERAKLYRERIEDILASERVAVESVDVINLVSRVGIASSFTAQEIFDAQKEDYDKYVFNDVGFEVYDVKISYWDRSGSTFQYGADKNPNFAGGEVAPGIVSIFARRMAA